jgi:TetR/AcrR family transcriptional repressor of nem operon
MSKMDEILEAAESMIRERGYNGFSFREIADAVGVKSASVHYHFKTKGDLGAAVANTYTEKFIDSLGDPEAEGVTPKTLIEGYIDACRYAVVKQNKMCLCGMLGAEVAALPENVAHEARAFFEKNIDWLAKVYARMPGVDPTVALRRAHGAVATVEGAMIIARTLKDADAFESAVNLIPTA